MSILPNLGHRSNLSLALLLHITNVCTENNTRPGQPKQGLEYVVTGWISLKLKNDSENAG